MNTHRNRPLVFTLMTSAAALTLLACSGASSSGSAYAQSEAASSLTMPRTLSVSGTGKAMAKPDMALLQFAVESRAKDAEGALQANAATMAKVMAAMKKAGIAEKDMQTAGLYMNAEYERTNGRYTNKIIGHVVNASLTIKVRNIDKAGSVIDSAIANGANRMNSLSFGFQDDEALKNEARRAAVADAKASASLYAEEAGVKLGAIISISEGYSAAPGPQPLARSIEMDGLQATPIAAGESGVTAAISMVFELR